MEWLEEEEFNDIWLEVYIDYNLTQSEQYYASLYENKQMIIVFINEYHCYISFKELSTLLTSFVKIKYFSLWVRFWVFTKKETSIGREKHGPNFLFELE